MPKSKHINAVNAAKWLLRRLKQRNQTKSTNTLVNCNNGNANQIPNSNIHIYLFFPISFYSTSMFMCLSILVQIVY